MKIEIDLSTIQSSDGTYNSNDVKVIERLTGKSFSEVVKTAQDYDFTAKEVQNMSDEEYAEKRQDILKAQKEGRIK